MDSGQQWSDGRLTNHENCAFAERCLEGQPRPTTGWPFLFMTLLSTTYCTQDDMSRKVGANALRNWTDHDKTGAIDTNVIADAINQATQEIDAYAGQRYSQTGLSSSTLINRWATILACYFCAQNRGNEPPNQLAVEFDRLMNPEFGLLIKVSQGKYQLPRVALRSDMRPTMSNLKVDRRFTQTKIRVEQQGSTDQTTTMPHNVSADDLPGLTY